MRKAVFSDVIIIGAGVVGAAIARELSRYRLKVALLEKECDVGLGSSKANSAIIHAGFHAPSGTLKAKLTPSGNHLHEELARQLCVPFKRVGSLTIAFTSKDIGILERLQKQGKENAVSGLRIISQEELLKKEPRINPKAKAALYAPTTGIISPYEMTIALVENAARNGAQVYLNRRVLGIQVDPDATKIIRTNRGVFKARWVINSAGLHSDEIAKMVGITKFEIVPRKGEEYILDRSKGNLVSHVIYPVPTLISEGVLIIPTVYGNIMLGPTAEEVADKSDFSTTGEGFRHVMNRARKLLPCLSPEDVIGSFAGLRASLPQGDFVVYSSREVPGFISLIGIDSPGLTAAPILARMMVKMLDQEGLKLRPNVDFHPTRQAGIRFRQLSPQEKAEAVAENPPYGKVVCVCETVSEGEIVDAIRDGAITLDGVKFRTHLGMGRCQGSFCHLRAAEILCREGGISLRKLTKKGGKSRLLADGLASPAKRKRTPPRKKGTARGVHGAARSVRRTEVSLAIVGGGAAGLAAAVAARRAGAQDVLVLDRNEKAGGVLLQCKHEGFGLRKFRVSLSGKEYIQKFLGQARKLNVKVMAATTVLEINSHKEILIVSEKEGVRNIRAKTIILAMGCRERQRGEIGIPGGRPAGIFTAGAAQQWINMKGCLPGKKVVILGSGDVGLIMARRLTLGGAKVEAVMEIMSYPSGLAHNVATCLNEFKIPLYLEHMVTWVHGRERVEGVTVARMSKSGDPMVSTERRIDCDTLLLSAGLVPENELSLSAGVELDPLTGGPIVNERMETNLEGVFACGNVVHVHHLVDHISYQAEVAGRSAASYLEGNLLSPSRWIRLTPGQNIRYIVPQRISGQEKVTFFARVHCAGDRMKLRIGPGIAEKKIDRVSPCEVSVVDLHPEEICALDGLSHAEVSILRG